MENEDIRAKYEKLADFLNDNDIISELSKWGWIDLRFPDESGYRVRSNTHFSESWEVTTEP